MTIIFDEDLEPHTTNEVLFGQSGITYVNEDDDKEYTVDYERIDRIEN